MGISNHLLKTRIGKRAMFSVISTERRLVISFEESVLYEVMDVMLNSYFPDSVFLITSNPSL